MIALVNEKSKPDQLREFLQSIRDYKNVLIRLDTLCDHTLNLFCDKLITTSGTIDQICSSLLEGHYKTLNPYEYIVLNVNAQLTDIDRFMKTESRLRQVLVTGTLVITFSNIPVSDLLLKQKLDNNSSRISVDKLDKSKLVKRLKELSLLIAHCSKRSEYYELAEEGRTIKDTLKREYGLSRS